MTENVIVIQEPASEASRYEFRVSSGMLQWRPSATYSWRNLVDLGTLLGEGGGPIEIPDSDGIDEGVVHLFLTTSERSKLSGIAIGAEVNVQPDWDAPSGDAHILNKPALGTAAAEEASSFAAASHGHSVADVSGLSEAVDDRVAALLVGGANITLTYDDVAGTIIVESTGGGGETSYDSLPAGTTLTVSYDETNLVWPARPTARTDITVIWVGPSDPAVPALETDLLLVSGSLPDTTPPTVPADLALVSATTSSITASWSASTDAVGVTGYQIRLDGGTAVDKTSSQLTHTFSDLAADTSYNADVRARDAAGNWSAWSATVAMSTEPASDPSLRFTEQSYNGTDTVMSVFSAAPSRSYGSDLNAGGYLANTWHPAAGFRLTVQGARFYNPADAPSSHLTPDLTFRIWTREFDASVQNAVVGATTANANQTKVHSGTRTAGTWTEVTFDSPLSVVPPVSGINPTDDEIIIVGVQVGSGQFYIAHQNAISSLRTAAGRSAGQSVQVGNIWLAESPGQTFSLGGSGMDAAGSAYWSSIDIIYTVEAI